MADWSRTTNVPRRRFIMPRLNRDPQIITLPIYPADGRLFAEQWRFALCNLLLRQNDRLRIALGQRGHEFPEFRLKWKLARVSKGTARYFCVFLIKF